MAAERRFQFVFLCFSLPFISAGLNDGLYVSNGTDILRILNPDSASSETKSIFSQSGTIVGVAYEKSSGILFWSTVDIMTRGIYRGYADSSGNIQNATKIIDYDVLEVNCLTFDWLSKNLYWTDSRKKTVEVSKADGSNRRILLMTGMVSPRGIYVDPVNGFLFWTDHGRKRIERSNLDGSNRRVIVDQNVSLPNQIITSESRLYWVDSDSKSLESSSLSGDHRTSRKLTINGQSLGSNEHVFGLAIKHTTAYVTKWNSGKLIRVDTSNGKSPSAVGDLGNGKIFGAVYVQLNHQTTSNSDPCGSLNCASLCLPKSTREARCSCPSYGGKTLSSDGRTCHVPSAVLLFAVASSGFVCFRDPSVEASRSETYVVGRSPRPVAVAYDPTTQVVYWSDVRLRSVHSAKIDGTGHRIILGSQNGIGLVEGMVVDAKRRQLFYTNVGSVLLETTPYTWHRVETISLDATKVKVKTLVTTADRPRGLALDSVRGHLYYTDWGSRASIVRVDLDGSNPTLIRTGLDNPNAIAFSDRVIYFVDSHFKTRRSQANDRYPSPPKNGSLYQMNLDGTGLTDVMSSSSEKFVTPFGLTLTPNGDFYVSDWDRKSLSLVKGSPRGQITSFLSDVEEVMATHYSQYSDASGSTQCSRMSCTDLCLARNANDVQCTCNSYGGKAANNSSCLVPRNFILVADMNSIKIVSLDEGYSTPYIAVQGNPYFSNYAALTYDPTANIVYYSDVNRKAIHALYLENMTSTVFYRVNEIVDGLAFNAGSLYWTDFANGRISKLRIGEPAHRTFAKKLNRPRGIRVHSEYLYWTEWGDKPRVVRKNLGADVNSPPEVIYSETKTPRLVWPNGIHIDSINNRLYFVDGSTKIIFNCSLTGGCQPLPGTESVVKHAYDIWLMDGSFYYSDWKSGAVNAFRPDKPNVAWKVIGDLMRPTQMYIRRQPSSSSSSGSCGSPKGGGCGEGGQCIPLIVNSRCDCKGKAPSFDGKSCTASPGSCFHGGRTYSSGEVYVPKACVSCQCVGSVPYALDPLYNNSLCRRIDCPALVGCLPDDVRQPTGDECCPTCTKCGVRITNCPTRDVTLVLPANFRFTVYDYLPAVRDCRGLSREIAFVKRPDGSIYDVGTNRVTVTARATSPDGTVDSNTCSYSIIVQDKTPPTIICPSNVQRYVTDDSLVPLQWDSPQAFDNVGLRGAPVPSLQWGSSRGVGRHTVTYTATDTSGLSSSCSFNVTVTKLYSKQSSCRIPSIANAVLNCTDQTNSLKCSIASCDPVYTRTSVSRELSCRNGTWTPTVDDDLLRDACIKEKDQTIVGTLEIRASGVCASDVDLQYTEKFLSYSLGKDYTRLTGIDEDVTAKCQPPPAQDLVVELKLKGEGGVEKEQAIKTKLTEIETELKKGFLRVNYRDKDGVHSAQTMEINVKTTTRQCLPGQILHDSKCKVCSPGKFQSDDRCEKCGQDQYNDEEGQTTCKPCPDARKSFPGAYIVDQCTVEDEPFPMILVMIIGGSVLFLLVVLVVVVVCCRRRYRRQSYPPKDQSMLHPNNAYGCYAEETYDEIGLGDPTGAADDCGAGCGGGGGPSTSAQNYYEGLQDAGAVGGQSNYDTIAKCSAAGDDKGCGGEEKGECSSVGGASNRSGNSSYLVPVGSAPNKYTVL